MVRVHSSNGSGAPAGVARSAVSPCANATSLARRHLQVLRLALDRAVEALHPAATLLDVEAEVLQRRGQRVLHHVGA